MRVVTVLKIIVFLVIIAGVGFFSYRVGVFVGEENILRTPPLAVGGSAGEGLEKPDQVDFSIFWETWRKLELHFLEKER